MAAILGYGGIFIGAIGIFFGLFYLSEDPSFALKIVAFTAVGCVATLAFIRHVLFYKSDAQRMGWETSRPEWMFEVGFANLAFGIMGFISTLGEQQTSTRALVVLGYGVYLFQASMLHGFNYMTSRDKSAGKFWRGCVTTFLYAAWLLYFSIPPLFT